MPFALLKFALIVVVFNLLAADMDASHSSSNRREELPRSSLLPCVKTARHKRGKRVRNTGSHGISALEGFNHDMSLPRFAEQIPNVTVTIGRDALLACVVDNLRGFKVAWVRVDTQTILSIHHNIITQNPRITLSYNDHRSWYLQIKNVQEADRGWYMCQVNTDPMRSKKGFLQVVVPPNIIDRETSSDIVALESTNVSMNCKATGYPEPFVMWRREDGKNYRYKEEYVNVVDGEVLFLNRVSRLHMGKYLCIASNGVPPSVSKQVELKVQFPPMISIQNQLEGAYLGQDIRLECKSEAYPDSINYWTTHLGGMIISGDKYEALATVHDYTKTMELFIRKVNLSDFGWYKCISKNSLGETDGVIKLEKISPPRSLTTHLPTTLPKNKGRGRGGKRRERGGGSGDNRVNSDKIKDGIINSEFDFDEEFTLSSQGPPSMREPPGAYSRISALHSSNTVLLPFTILVLLVLYHT